MFVQLAADYLEAHESEYIHFVDDSLGSFKEYAFGATLPKVHVIVNV